MKRAKPQQTAAADSERDSLELRRSKLRLLGVALLCAKLALVPLVFDLSFDLPFTVPKVLLSHGIAYVLAGVIVGLLIRHGRAFFVWSWLHVPVLAFLLANAIATLFAGDQLLALYGAHARMLGLGTIADYVLLYLAVVLLVRSRAEAAVVILCAVAASSVVVAYETVQLTGHDPFPWTTDSQARPFSTIGQSTSLAQYLIILAFGAFSLGVLIDGWPLALRGLAMLYAVVLLVAAVATGTRSGLLGFVSGGVVLLLLMWILHPSPRARLLSALATGLAATVMAILLLLTPLGSRVASTIQTVTPSDGNDDSSLRLEPSAAGRAELYGTAFRMLQERPWFGYGPDNFAVGVPKYRPERADFVRRGTATSAHGWLTQVASTSGLSGLGTFLGVIFVGLWLTIQRGFRPIAISGAVMLAAFLGTGLTTINDVVADSLFWMSVGMIGVGTTDLMKAAPAEPQHRRAKHIARVAPWRRVAALLCTAAGLTFALTTANAMQASRLAEMSRDSRGAGRYVQAVDFGMRATRSDSGRAQYWDLLGLAFAASARWPEAGVAFDRAASLAPYDLTYLADLIQVNVILVSNGDSLARTKGLQLADRAVRIDPNNPRAHVLRAQVMQVTSNLSEASRSIERALALDPQSTDAQLYFIAAQVANASGRPADAIEVARQGLEVLGTGLSSVALRTELARALLAVNQPDRALTEIDAALAIQPSEPSAKQLRSEILTALQR